MRKPSSGLVPDGSPDRLWGPTPERHEALREQGRPWDRLSSKRLAIPVTPQTFWAVPETARAGARHLGKPEPDVQAFDPRPLEDAPLRLKRWARRTREILAPLHLDLEPTSSELTELLELLARRVDPMNRGELLRLLGTLTGGVFRGPSTFHLDVANACNVNCDYCWFHSQGAAKRADAHLFDAAWRSDMVPWDLFTKLVDDLDALDGREDVLLSGKGEPLLHPRCLDMIQYIKARDLGLTLFTNGVLLREQARRALVDHGANLVYVSLSSASPEVYEMLHPGHNGRAELGEVLDNVLALNALKRRQGALVPRVMMVDVLNAANASEALDFYEQARRIGAEHVRYQLIHVQDANRHLALRPEQVEPLRLAIAEAQRRADAGGPTVVANIHRQLESLAPESGRWGYGRTPDEGCYVGWTFSRSWTNGDVSFCCSPKVVDSLRDRSFAEIWGGRRYSEFRNAARDLAAHGDLQFANGATLLGEHCTSCPNYEGIDSLAEGLRRHGLQRFVHGPDRQRLGSLHGLRRLFSDRADEHLWRAPVGHDFTGAVAEAGSLNPEPGRPALVVVPTRYTFHRLPEVCAFAASVMGGAAGALPPPLPLMPVASLWERFLAHVDELDEALSPLGVVVGLEDPDLQPLLERLQHAGTTGQFPDVDLLHALGALCEQDLVGLRRDELASPLHRFDERVLRTLTDTALVECVVIGPRAELQPGWLPGLASPLTVQVAALLAPAAPPRVAPPLASELTAVPVREDDWYRLESVASAACTRRGESCPELPGPGLVLRPLRGLTGRLVARVAELNEALRPLGVGLDLSAGQVLPMLQALEEGLDAFDPARIVELQPSAAPPTRAGG